MAALGAAVLTLVGFFLAVSWTGAWVALPFVGRAIGLVHLCRRG